MIAYRPRPFASSGVRSHHAPDSRIELAHLSLDLRVDLDEEILVGRSSYRFRGRDGGAQEIALDAVQFAALSLAPPCESVETNYDGSRLVLRFRQPLSAGETREVHLDFRVESPKTGLFFSKGGDDVDQPRFAATDHETERARYWLPTVDHPSVRPTLDITLRSEASLMHLAVGELREERIEGDERISRWVLDQPCPSYLTCFAIGEFKSWDGGTVEGSGRPPLPIAAYAPANSKIDLARSFEPTARMIMWMERKLACPLPIPKYVQFGVPFIGGAMENMSLVSWDARYLLDDALVAERKPLMDIINLHELAHSWFGNHVVCRDHSHAWLKESWATYMESCWLEENEGADEGIYDRFTCAERYFAESRKDYVRPIVTRSFDHSWLMFDRHLYPGGAWRLHMLRRLLGDEVFWRATQDYVARFGARTAETDDFRRVLEEHSGRSLTRFFEEWLYGHGYPELKIRYRYELASKDGVFSVEQTQAAPPSKDAPLKNDRIFHFDLPLHWWIGEERHHAHLQVRGKHAELRVPMERSADRIAIDPDQHVLHALELDAPPAMLERMLEQGPLTARIAAARALAKNGTPSALRALKAAFLGDVHWGLRSEIASALGDAPKGAAPLASLCEEHGDPRTLAALFQAAGKHRSRHVRKALLARLEAGLPPIASAAAAEALGAQRNAEDLPFLQRGSTSGHVESRSGHLRGLAASSHPEALPHLLDVLNTGERARVRCAAAEAIGAILVWLPHHARLQALGALEDALRADVPALARAAASALITGGAQESVLALRTYVSTLSDQERIAESARVDRMARTQGWKAELEGLKERLRELELSSTKEG